MPSNISVPNMTAQNILRSSRRFVVAGLVALALAPAVPAVARPTETRAPSAALSAKGFLEGIYRAYVGTSPAAKGIALDQPETVRRYFSPGLASLILEDSAEAFERGAVPTLSGDPFVGHQEWQISDLAIDVKDASIKAVGTVSFTNFGKPETLVLELLKVGDAWRIADIRWPSGSLRELYRRGVTDSRHSTALPRCDAESFRPWARADALPASSCQTASQPLRPTP